MPLNIAVMEVPHEETARIIAPERELEDASTMLNTLQKSLNQRRRQVI